MHRWRVGLVTLGLLTQLAGCGGWGPDTAFKGDGGHAAIGPTNEERSADIGPSGPYCHPDSQGHYPINNLEIGKSGSTGGYNFAYGGGCIHRPLREVWAATHNSAAWAWANADMTYYKPISDPRGLFSFEGRYEAGPFFARNDWIISYYQSLDKDGGGTVASPEKVIINYQKTRGTRYIRRWQGTVELRRLTDRVTSFVMRDTLDATQTDVSNCKKSVHDLLGKLRELPPNYQFLDGKVGR